MCTAAVYKTKDSYFGRTLDYEFSYGEKITITPRNYPFSFREMGKIDSHYAIIGMAHTDNGYPLYYDAVNEKGLAMAGLNFVGNAVYTKPKSGFDNIAQFELLPWILCKCSDIGEAKALIKRLNIIDTPYSDRFPPSQLHWMIADKEGCITLEQTEGGLKVYDNPVGVLTNNPPFDVQMLMLANYMNLTNKSPENRFSKELDLKPYGRGMGAIGLPGDLSSQSRFVRAAFVKLNSVSGESEEESVSQFFHILSSVDQQRGCCELEEGKFEITIYTSCMNTDKGIYYYTTYDNHRINAVDMHREELDGNQLIEFALKTKEEIAFQN